jgi:hypothetical protein
MSVDEFVAVRVLLIIPNQHGQIQSRKPFIPNHL